jgi:hypothetical protein
MKFVSTELSPNLRDFMCRGITMPMVKTNTVIDIVFTLQSLALLTCTGQSALTIVFY